MEPQRRARDCSADGIRGSAVGLQRGDVEVARRVIRLAGQRVSALPGVRVLRVFTGNAASLMVRTAFKDCVQPLGHVRGQCEAGDQ